MFAVVESGKITSMPKGNKGITIGDNQYPAAIFTLWSEAERNAIGVYTIEIDNTNKNDVAAYALFWNSDGSISIHAEMPQDV